MATNRDKQVQIAEGGSLNGGTVTNAKTVTTADATVTPILSLPLAEGEAVSISLRVTGSQADESDATAAWVEACARRAAAGNVTLIGSAAVRILESDAATNVTVTADTTAQTVNINVVGVAAEAWRWEAVYSYTKI